MAEPRPREDLPARGVLMMSLAVLLFTCIDTSAKWLILSGLPTFQVIFARYAGHFLTAMVVFVPSEGPAVFRTRRPALQLLRSAALLASTAFNFLALKYLPLTLTTAILFAGPIVVSLLSIPILGEKIGIRRFAAIIVGFAGVLIVIQPWSADFEPAMLLSLGGLLCASLYFVLTRMIAGVESNSTSQLWASGVATLAILPFALGVWAWPATTSGWIVLGLIGVFGATSHILATAAHRYADASLLAPVVYAQVLYATLASWVVFATAPGFWTVVGAPVIVASGLYIGQRERRLYRERLVGATKADRTDRANSA